MRQSRPVPPVIAALFDELGTEQFVAYPSLTRDELVALDDVPLLRDADDLSWWDALGGATRDEVRATAQRGLLARGLVSIDDADPSTLDVVSRVRTVLALRRAPAFVTLVGNVERASPVLRCYGVVGGTAGGEVAGGEVAGGEVASGEVASGDVAVLVEARVITGVAEYVVCRLSYAATVVTRFVFAPPDETDPDAVPAPPELGGRMVRRRLEMFAPGRLEGGARFLASAGVTAGALAPVDDAGRAGPAHGVTEESMTALLTETWSEHAALAALLLHGDSGDRSDSGDRGGPA